MKLFAYYAFHSVINQIKKIFKTWIGIFILICLGIGVVFGASIGIIMAIADDANEKDPTVIVTPGKETEDTEPSAEPEQTEPVDDTEEDPEDDPSDDEEEEYDGLVFRNSNDEVVFVLSSMNIFDLIVTAIILLVFVLMLMMMDKGSFFLPADTMLLFTSPMTPQSVLYFRLSCTMGAMVFAGVYILFQIPNLTLNLGLGVGPVIAVMIGYVLILMESTLFRVMAYIFSTGSKKKATIVRYFTIGLLLAMAAAGFAYGKITGIESIPASLVMFFTLKETRYFPFIGWIKGFVMSAAEDNLTAALIYFALTVAGCAFIVFVISKMKCDFYEEAMAKSEEVAAALAAQKEKGIMGGTQQRKTDRADKLRRDGMKHGNGANVFFFKEMYNRFRFAILGVFTKTSITYLVVAIGMSLILRFLADYRSLIPVAAVIALIAFYRTLGNPLEKDTSLHYFALIPEKASTKLFWSMLAGLTNTALDVVVPIAIAGIILGENPLMIIGCFFFILSLDFVSTVAGTFIGLSVPVNAGGTIKMMVQAMFLSFGFMPSIAIIALASIFLEVSVGFLIAALVNFGVGAALFAFLPLFF